MKRKIVTLIGLTISMCMLAGCGKTEGNVNAEPAEEVSQKAEAAEIAEEADSEDTEAIEEEAPVEEIDFSAIPNDTVLNMPVYVITQVEGDDIGLERYSYKIDDSGNNITYLNEESHSDSNVSVRFENGVRVDETTYGRHFECKIDENGRVEEVLNTNKEDESDYVTCQYTYDDAGDILSAYTHYSDEADTPYSKETMTYEYDSEGRVIKQITSQGSYYEFEYDEKNRMVKMIETSIYDDGEKGSVYENVMRYDVRGLLAELKTRKTYDPDGESNYSYYAEYTHDAPISRKISISDSDMINPTEEWKEVAPGTGIPAIDSVISCVTDSGMGTEGNMIYNTGIDFKEMTHHNYMLTYSFIWADYAAHFPENFAFETQKDLNEILRAYYVVLEQVLEFEIKELEDKTVIIKDDEIVATLSFEQTDNTYRLIMAY